MDADKPIDVYERASCPVYTALGVIEGRWKPMIYRRLLERPRGFGELRRSMPRVTARVLREQLRQTIADDLIEREELAPRWQGHRYRVTSYGLTLGTVFETLWSWGALTWPVPARPAGRRNPSRVSGVNLRAGMRPSKAP